jgi:hypothetical protein
MYFRIVKQYYFKIFNTAIMGGTAAIKSIVAIVYLVKFDYYANLNIVLRVKSADIFK